MRRLVCLLVLGGFLCMAIAACTKKEEPMKPGAPGAPAKPALPKPGAKKLPGE